jgi:acetoin utilization deacetylase AcuC-like enzyme
VRNVPLPAGTTGAAWRDAVAGAWFDALDAFAPQLVLFSAGFDAHARDPLGDFGLVEDDFRWITHQIAALAAAHAEGRVVSVLEGGYDLDALAASVVEHVGALTPAGRG